MQIRIKSYTFTLSEPFQQGTVITRGEAQALNDLRAENIQNNLRKTVNDAVAGLGPDQLLSPEVLAALQARFAEYDANYQFLERHTPKPRLGDIDAEAREIARERIEAQLHRLGTGMTASEMEAAIAANETLPAVQEEARLRVSARRRAVGAGLESL